MIAVSLSLSGCTTTPAGTDTTGDQKDKRRTIDAGVDSTLTRLYYVVPVPRELVGKANGLLVFPTVINAGIGLGGQYGVIGFAAAKAGQRGLMHRWRY
jgi:lipid-binding SYLF domain-containing protein